MQRTTQTTASNKRDRGTNTYYPRVKKIDRKTDRKTAKKTNRNDRQTDRQNIQRTTQTTTDNATKDEHLLPPR